MKKLLTIFIALAMLMTLAACGGGESNSGDGGSENKVANADKPLVWFNRQPSNSST